MLLCIILHPMNTYYDQRQKLETINEPKDQLSLPSFFSGPDAPVSTALTHHHPITSVTCQNHHHTKNTHQIRIDIKRPLIISLYTLTLRKQ
jgi:hypothetical protein